MIGLLLNDQNMKATIEQAIAWTSARGIPCVKKDDILSKLGALMHANRVQFLQTNPISHVEDLSLTE